MEQLLGWKFLVLSLWLLLFLIWERLQPASFWKQANPHTGFSQGRHLLQNGALWLVNMLVSPLLVISITAYAVEFAPPWRPDFLDGGQGILLDILLLDIWIYCWHRANHVLPVLWRFHQVHHLDEQLDATSALRFHFGEVLLSALARAPLIFLFAIPLYSVICFEILVTMAAIFHHSNVRLPVRMEQLLSKLIVTPQIHWVHHHAIRVDTDSNYGTLLSCWDRLFASRSLSKRRPDMMLGIEKRTENAIPELLWLPFVPASKARRHNSHY